MEQQYRHMYKQFFGTGIALICFLLLLPFLPFRPVGAQSQPPTDTSREQEIDAKIKSFFEILARGNPSLAFDGLLSQSPYSTLDAGQASTELRSTVDELSTRLGGILNYERYDTQRIGDDIILTRYVLKYENAPVVWTFAFYRKPALSPSVPSNSWMFVQVHFDTDLRLLLR